MPIVAAAAAAAGVGLGWWASRKKGSDPDTQRQLDLGQRMLQMEDSTVQNIEDYENLQYEMEILDTTAKNQKREVAELQSSRRAERRQLKDLEHEAGRLARDLARLQAGHGKGTAAAELRQDLRAKEAEAREGFDMPWRDFAKIHANFADISVKCART